MPVARYFLFVGGVLLALLLISNAYLPKLTEVASAATDLRVIRFLSDHKWPERVVFDTNRPTIAAVQVASAQVSPSAPAIADASAKARVREAFAQLQPPDTKLLQASEAKKPERKLVKRKVARRRAAPPAMLVAQQPQWPQQPQFGFFANNTW